MYVECYRNFRQFLSVVLVPNWWNFEERYQVVILLSVRSVTYIIKILNSYFDTLNVILKHKRIILVCNLVLFWHGQVWFWYDECDFYQQTHNF
jgi:hypothetical protein